MDAEAVRMAEQLAVLGVLLVPLLAAVIVWVLGPGRGPAVRGVAVAASVLTLALALFLAVRFSVEVNRADGRADARTTTTFVPEFVPGSTQDRPHETTWDVLPVGNTSVRFFLGIDGLN